VTFRDVYLTSFMADFGDDLEKFNGNNTGRGRVHMDLLLQCIEAGATSFSAAQQTACMQHVRMQQNHAPCEMGRDSRAWL
jgi:hypothetical protein